MTGPVLVVEDDAPVREALGQTLELEGFSPILAGSFVVAKDHIRRDFSGVILSDVRMPGRDGLFLLEHVQGVDSDLPVILLTGEGDIPTAIGATRKGVFEFLEKPCGNDVLLETVTRAMKARALVIENRRLKAMVASGDAAEQMIFGKSDKVLALRAAVRKLAALDEPVLIQGAPGAGVDKIAEVMHLLSPRSTRPFRRVAAAALSPDQLTALVDECEGGTLYLDQVTALPPETQFALTHVLDEGRSTRILAGTFTTANRETFNTDLHYRLEALTVRIPALKERPEDIPVLFRHYVQKAREQTGVEPPPITEEVIAGLMAQDWPGNARALMNAATRFVLGQGADAGEEEMGLTEKLAQVERALLIEGLRRHSGNASLTAEHFKLPRKTLYDKFAKYGIKPAEYR